MLGSIMCSVPVHLMCFEVHAPVEGHPVSPCAACMPKLLQRLDILPAHALSVYINFLLCIPQVNPTSLFDPFSTDGFDAADIFPLPTGSSSSGVVISSTSGTSGQSGEVATWGPSTGNQVHVQRWTLPATSSSTEASHSSKAMRRSGTQSTLIS